MLLDISVAVEEINNRIREWEAKEHECQSAVLNELRAIKLKLLDMDSKAMESMAKHYEEEESDDHSS
jgi:hypothetical protein